MTLNIYVASSWRNQFQPSIISILQNEGYNVYDFRNPIIGNTGFHWSEIDIDWKTWTPEEYRFHLNHPIAEYGYSLDYKAMQWANVFLGIQPFGRSASMEMGWAAGKGKHTILLLSSEEPELMVKMFDYICCDIKEVLNILRTLSDKEI